MVQPGVNLIQGFAGSSALYNHAIQEIMEGMHQIEVHEDLGDADKVKESQSTVAYNIVIRDLAERGIIASGGWVDKSSMAIIPPITTDTLVSV